MRRIFQVLSWAALALTVVPSLLFLRGTIDLDQVKWLMLTATVAWFVFTPLWMGREKPTKTADA